MPVQRMLAHLVPVPCEQPLGLRLPLCHAISWARHVAWAGGLRGQIKVLSKKPEPRAVAFWAEWSPLLSWPTLKPKPRTFTGRGLVLGWRGPCQHRTMRAQPYLSRTAMQLSQKRCPHSVCLGLHSTRWHFSHLYLSSTAFTNLSL